MFWRPTISGNATLPAVLGDGPLTSRGPEAPKLHQSGIKLGWPHGHLHLRLKNFSLGALDLFGLVVQRSFIREAQMIAGRLVSTDFAVKSCLRRV